MELADRLKSARESLGKTQKDMAAALDVSVTAIQSYESGRQVPGGKVFESLARMGFNSNWLLTGEGSMLRGEPLKAVAELHDKYVPGREDYVLVPRYKVAASAGGGAIVDSEQIVDYLSFKADWIRNGLGLSVKDLALINVKGDSMEPTLSNNDLILIDMRAGQVEDNAIYVLQYNGVLLVKRVQRKLDGTVIVKGDNPVYDPEVLLGDKAGLLNVIGRVVWCGRRM